MVQITRISNGTRILFGHEKNRNIVIEKDHIMGKAIVKCKIATYAEDQYVVEVPCQKDDVDELILARAWKILKEEEKALPYGNRTAEIIKRYDDE